MHGTSFTLKMGTTILAWPISSFILLPVFKQLDGISIFQYVELRFHPYLRRFISILFIGQMLFYSAITLYLPSLPLHATLGVPQTVSIGLVGSICIVYSSFGGIKAVTWTNLYHTILLLLSMMSILVIGCWKCGGPAKLLADSYQGGRLSLGDQFWHLDLTTRHTVYNTLFGYTLVRLFLHGTSQMQIQSALSLSTMRRSQASQLLSACIYFLIQIMASSIGLVLYVSYRDCDPFLSGDIKRQDELLVHYVSSQLAKSGVPAIQGLFLAATFGSTLTAMSSFQSSTSAIVVEDFFKPIWSLIKGDKGQLSDERAATVGKVAAIFLGFACILLTFQMDKISGLQQASTTLYGVVGAPILATFLLGTLSRKVNSFGMFCGLISAICFGTWVFVSQLSRAHPLEASLSISTSGCSQSSNFKGPQLDKVGQVLLVGPNSNNQTGTTNFGGSQNLTVLTDGELDDQVKIVSDFQLSELLGLDENSTPEDLRELQQEGDALQLMLTFKQLTEMSYLWLPVFTLTITVLVAFFMSWLSRPAAGPWWSSKQCVDDKLLAPFLARTNKPASLELGGQPVGARVAEQASGKEQTGVELPCLRISVRRRHEKEEELAEPKAKLGQHKNSIEIYLTKSRQSDVSSLSSLDRVLAANMKL